MNLLDACRTARDTFARYAELHDAKGTDEGREKAAANRALAKMLTDAAESDPQAFGALSLVADLRAALGDPEGRLMQDDFVEYARRVKAAQRRGDVAMTVLRQIAEGKRRTREQRLASACVRLLDELPEAGP